MSKRNFLSIIFVQVQSLCDKIQNYFGISYNEAIKILYHSKLYKALEQETTKMWYFSSYDLFNMFLEEYKTGNYTVYGG